MSELYQDNPEFLPDDLDKDAPPMTQAEMDNAEDPIDYGEGEYDEVDFFDIPDSFDAGSSWVPEPANSSAKQPPKEEKHTFEVIHLPDNDTREKYKRYYPDKIILDGREIVPETEGGYAEVLMSFNDQPGIFVPEPYFSEGTKKHLEMYHLFKDSDLDRLEVSMYGGKMDMVYSREHDENGDEYIQVVKDGDVRHPLTLDGEYTSRPYDSEKMMGQTLAVYPEFYDRFMEKFKELTKDRVPADPVKGDDQSKKQPETEKGNGASPAQPENAQGGESPSAHPEGETPGNPPPADTASEFKKRIDEIRSQVEGKSLGAIFESIQDAMKDCGVKSMTLVVGGQSIPLNFNDDPFLVADEAEEKKKMERMREEIEAIRQRMKGMTPEQQAEESRKIFAASGLSEQTFDVDGDTVKLSAETEDRPKWADDDMPGIIVEINGRIVTRSEYVKFIDAHKDEFVDAFCNSYLAELEKLGKTRWAYERGDTLPVEDKHRGPVPGFKSGESGKDSKDPNAGPAPGSAPENVPEDEIEWADGKAWRDGDYKAGKALFESVSHKYMDNNWNSVAFSIGDDEIQITRKLAPDGGFRKGTLNDYDLMINGKHVKYGHFMEYVDLHKDVFASVMTEKIEEYLYPGGRPIVPSDTKNDSVNNPAAKEPDKKKGGKENER